MKGKEKKNKGKDYTEGKKGKTKNEEGMISF